MKVRDYHFAFPPAQLFNYASTREVTRVLNSLSLLFPVGERFFMDSIRAWEPLVHDEKLLEDIKIFYKQEGRHGREHTKLNKLLSKHGIDLDALNKDILKILEKHGYDKGRALMATTTLERLTGALGYGLNILDRFILKDNAYGDLWRYHAIEEVEHVHVSEELAKRFLKFSMFEQGRFLLIALYEVFIQTYRHYKLLKKVESKSTAHTE